MPNQLPIQFLVLLALPLIAKLAMSANAALVFIYDIPDGLFLPFLLSALLVLTTVVFSIRYLIKGAWLKGVALASAACLSVILPRIDFHPEDVLFNRNKQAYLAVIDADPSPHPKFQFFRLRDFFAFPAGGTLYSVMYDETG